MKNNPVNGILLLYHHRLWENAPTFTEHVGAFAKHSRFKVWTVNTELGFPPELNSLQFRIILLHYSLFVRWFYYQLNKRFLNYIAQNDNSYKIAFFQDEYQFCQHRFDFLNNYNIDCVYTLLEEDYFDAVYNRYTHVPKIVYTIPGYVSDELIKLAKNLEKPDDQRKIDIGYRARPVDYFMGRGAQEKTEIAKRFSEFSRGSGLLLDISTDESKRIYGPAWYEFLADCRAVLGVESGVSIFDLTGEVQDSCETLLAKNPLINFEEISKKILHRWEDNIYYRTISPRHFEAAAFRICQILFEGRYSGIMQPMVHYIPLKKDFSNFDEVIRLFKDVTVRKQLTDNAYRDLIAAGKYSYKTFIDSFDRLLLDTGMTPLIGEEEIATISETLGAGQTASGFRSFIKMIRYYPFPGKALLTRPLKPFVEKYRRYRQSKFDRHQKPDHSV